MSEIEWVLLPRFKPWDAWTDEDKSDLQRLKSLAALRDEAKRIILKCMRVDPILEIEEGYPSAIVKIYLHLPIAGGKGFHQTLLRQGVFISDEMKRAAKDPDGLLSMEYRVAKENVFRKLETALIKGFIIEEYEEELPKKITFAKDKPIYMAKELKK